MNKNQFNFIEDRHAESHFQVLVLEVVVREKKFNLTGHSII